MKKQLKKSILIDKILDKINKTGFQSLSIDEKTYLKNHNKSDTLNDLENWLYSDDESTFNNNGHKLLYSEFEYDEDIFYNQEKLIRVISQYFNKKPFSNNADWGGAKVWSINTDNNYVGTFLYLNDEDFILLKRTVKNDQYKDKVLKTITNTEELYNTLLHLKKP